MMNQDMLNPATRAQGETSRTLSAEQIGCVLNDIAATAMHIQTLIIRQRGCDDDEQMVDALSGAIQSMAQRIGWAADMAAKRVPESGGEAFGDAARWMMPPSFHWEEEVKKETGGVNHG